MHVNVWVAFSSMGGYGSIDCCTILHQQVH